MFRSQCVSDFGEDQRESFWLDEPGRTGARQPAVRSRRPFPQTGMLVTSLQTFGCRIVIVILCSAVRTHLHLERCASASYRQTDGLLEQGVSWWSSLGHIRATFGANVQAVRSDKGRVAGQRQAGAATEGLRLRRIRVGEERESAAPGLHQRFHEQRELVLQDLVKEDESEGGGFCPGKYWAVIQEPVLHKCHIGCISVFAIRKKDNPVLVNPTSLFRITFVLVQKICSHLCRFR